MSTQPALPKRGLNVTALTMVAAAFVAILVFVGRWLQPVPAEVTPAQLSVGLVAAFLGGFLAILSPCSGAIVPAFFAYSFQGRDLVRKTYIFFVGLALVFVPLGFASSLVFGLFSRYQSAIVVVGGAVLIALSVATFFEVDLARPFQRRDRAGIASTAQHMVATVKDQETRVFVLGVVFGFATSSCTAPILGAIVTVAAGTGLAAGQAMVLFAVFAFGIAFPLFLLALAFERWEIAQRSWFRGRQWTIRVGRWTHSVHSTTAVTAAVLLVLGIVFLTTSATLELTEMYDRIGFTPAYERLNVAIQQALGPVPWWITSGAFVSLLAGFAWWLRRRAATRRSQTAQGDIS